MFCFAYVFQTPQARDNNALAQKRFVRFAASARARYNSIITLSHPRSWNHNCVRTVLPICSITTSRDATNAAK